MSRITSVLLTSLLLSSCTNTKKVEQVLPNREIVTNTVTEYDFFGLAKTKIRRIELTYPDSSGFTLTDLNDDGIYHPLWDSTVWPNDRYYKKILNGEKLPNPQEIDDKYFIDVK